MTLARCGRCQALTTLEYSARVYYHDPGVPTEFGARKRYDLSMTLCPGCAKRASKHMTRFFRMTITRERVEA